MPLSHPITESPELFQDLLALSFSYLLEAFLKNDCRCFKFSLVLFEEESPIDVEFGIPEGNLVVVHVFEDYIRVAYLVGIVDPDSFN